jgi:hypothetical protein
MSNCAVVTVHGVGDPAAGDTLIGIAGAFGDKRYERQDLVVGRQTYPRLTSADPQLPDLIEVNWSDIQRPRRSWLGAARHVLRLAVALPKASFGFPAEGIRLRTSPFLQGLLELFLLWSVFPALVTFVHSGVPSDHRWECVVADFLVVFLAGALLAALWGCGRRIRYAGSAWIAATCGLALLLFVSGAARGDVVRATIRLDGFVHFATALALVATAVEVAGHIAHNRRGARSALTMLALNYLPVVAVSTVASVITAVVLRRAFGGASSLGVAGAAESWTAVFTSAIGYDVATVEAGMAVSTALIAAIALLGGLDCYLSRKGERAGRWIDVFLLMAPLALCLPALALLAGYLGLLPPLLRHRPSDTVVSIYLWSSLRVTPWLLLLLTPMTKFLDILGDVGFYIVPVTHPELSTQSACKQRLRALLTSLLQSPNECIHVVAHSQGSVIAFDTLSGLSAPIDHGGAGGALGDTSPVFCLTTLGSPLGTLYRRYLGWSIDGCPGPVTDWKNLYRSGDPLGGPVHITSVDLNTGPGGHVNYWTDPELQRRLRQCAGLEAN